MLIPKSCTNCGNTSNTYQIINAGKSLHGFPEYVHYCRRCNHWDKVRVSKEGDDKGIWLDEGFWVRGVPNGKQARDAYAPMSIRRLINSAG